MNRFKKVCIFSLVALITISGSLFAQNNIEGKEIYIPRDLQNNDFNNPESKWSYDRMATTENFVVFWEKDSEKTFQKRPN